MILLLLLVGVVVQCLFYLIYLLLFDTIDHDSLSVNVGESMITQSSKVRDLGVIFDQFLNFYDHITAICSSTHFHIRNIDKIKNLLSYDACSTLIRALISCRLDYCNSILYNVPISKMLMLTNKSYYNIAPPYLCELINKKESHVNTRL